MKYQSRFGAAIFALSFAASAFATGQNGNSDAASNNQITATPAPGGTVNHGGNHTGVGVTTSAAMSSANTNQANAKGGKSASKSGAVASANNAGNAETNVNIAGSSYEAPRIPVASAYAAGLVASFGTCLGSASGGVQGAAIGLSFGTTTLDEGCHLIRRMNALVVMGYPQAALTLACIEDNNMYTAIRMAGLYCQEGDRPQAIVYSVPAQPVQATVIPVNARNNRPAKADRN